ncbi:hypothetical protein ABK040_012141 [Willaertia magna]
MKQQQEGEKKQQQPLEEEDKEWMSDEEEELNINLLKQELETEEIPLESNIIKPFPSSDQFNLKKRTPVKRKIQRNEIYVSRKSNFNAQFKRGKSLLQKEPLKPIHIHGLGAAILTAVELALELKKEFHGKLQLNTTTSTVPLVDDFYSKQEEEYYVASQVRFNSAIHITCTRELKE